MAFVLFPPFVPIDFLISLFFTIKVKIPSKIKKPPPNKSNWLYQIQLLNTLWNIALIIAGTPNETSTFQTSTPFQPQDMNFLTFLLPIFSHPVSRNYNRVVLLCQVYNPALIDISSSGLSLMSFFTCLTKSVPNRPKNLLALVASQSKYV
jgi:hypothetical protein